MIDSDRGRNRAGRPLVITCQHPGRHSGGLKVSNGFTDSALHGVSDSEHSNRSEKVSEYRNSLAFRLKLPDGCLIGGASAFDSGRRHQFQHRAADLRFHSGAWNRLQVFCRAAERLSFPRGMRDSGGNRMVRKLRKGRGAFQSRGFRELRRHRDHVCADRTSSRNGAGFIQCHVLQKTPFLEILASLDHDTFTRRAGQ